MAVEDDATAESLLRDADLALYHAKQAGGQRYEIFNRRMALLPDNLHERERELRLALTNHQFELWYEPLYRLTTGELEGFESTLRWRRTDGSIDSFHELLPAGEETGLSISLGREALETVCRQLRDWNMAMPGNTLTLTVNLTQRQFYHDDMVAHLRRTLAATKAEPSRLMLEISEVAVNERPDVALAIVQRIADCGVRVALDNFGAGLAPFNHLVRLPIAVVKMDSALTTAATKSGRHLALVESLIHLAKSVGVQLVAQSIETPEQLNGLRRLGCELGQGRLLSEAIEPAGALQIAVEQHRALPPSV